MEENNNMETMEDFKDEINASMRRVREGDILTGTVIGVSETEAIIDLKYYAEGIIKAEHFSEDPDFMIQRDVVVGDEISAAVIAKDDGNGNILLSKKEANDELVWDKLKEMQQSQDILKVKVSDVVNAGVTAYVEGIRGFIPASKLALSYVENLEEYRSKEIEVRIITVEKENKKLVLSAKDILRELEEKEREHKISNIEVGFVTEGTVEVLIDYVDFISLGNGLSGLVHISQISRNRIKSPASVLNVGDKVKVKVIGIKENKISLSMKALEDAEAEEVVVEKFDLPETEGVTTNLGSLFAKLKL